MTKDEALKLALEALRRSRKSVSGDLDLAGCAYGSNDPDGHRYDDAKKALTTLDKAITAIKEALAQQDSKDKEQAKTDSFVRQLDEALANPEPWEKFCDSNCVWTDHHPDCKLAQPEPVAWLHRFIEGGISIGLKPADLERHPERWEPLYTSPPQRKPLTDEEIGAILEGVNAYGTRLYTFARAIEAAHGIKGEA